MKKLITDKFAVCMLVIFLIIVGVYIFTLFTIFLYDKYIIRLNECFSSNKKITIVINSHKNNTFALNKLLDSLKKCKEYNDYNIIVFIGGYYENANYKSKAISNNITFVYCNHNSIDFTGLISIMEFLAKKDEYYFYLHDTTVVGPQFLQKIGDIDITNEDTLRLRPSASMNIGIYSNNIIHQCSHILKKLKNTDDSKTQYYKKKGVEDEDIIFKNDKNAKLIYNKDNLVNVSEPYDYYNNGVLRIVEYYDIDLYKIKANWHVKDTYELKL
jgi:hypothetical protein